MKATNYLWLGLVTVLMLSGCATAQLSTSRRSISREIAQLHNRDYAKRNAAVQALSSDPYIAKAALPLLQRQLKTENEVNRRWWLKAAMQRCENNLPHAGEIYATPDHALEMEANAACKSGDGPYTIVKKDGVSCWKLPKHKPHAWSYLYFKVNKAIRQKNWETAEIELTYLDAGRGDIGLDYDSTDPHAAVHGAYANYPVTIHRNNSGQWRTVRFHLTNARFRGSENEGSDFRFSCHGDSLLVRSVRVWPTPSSN